MELIGKNAMLRDYIPEDYEDHVKWRTVETEWKNWDAPWNKNDRGGDSVIEYAERRLLKLKTARDEDIRWTFEICSYPERKHIGWMNCYCIDRFCNYSTTDHGRYCLGIDIVPQEYRGKGLGKEAFTLFQNYLLEFGITRIYTQTWSGNTRMIALAKSLGYVLYKEKKGFYKTPSATYSLLTFKLDLEDREF